MLTALEFVPFGTHIRSCTQFFLAKGLEQASKHRSWDHALRPDRLRVERYRASLADRQARPQTSEQPACSQRHLLGAAHGRAVARFAGAIRALHNRLQSLQPLAQGRHLGSPDGCRGQGARRQGADDRQLDCARPSARIRGQKKSGDRCVGRSRGGLSTKIHARVDAKGRPLCLLISPGEVHDVTCAEALLDGLAKRAVVIADKGYDADRVRAHIRAQGAIPNSPNRAHRRRKFRWKKTIYRERNQVERFFNKLKQFRRIATRYDKLGATFFAFIKIAAVRIWLRSIESTA